MKTTIEKLSKHIYAIDQQMVRAFIICGQDKALLIDTGAVPVDIMSYIAQVTNLPVTLCLSHSDPDHIANVGAFKELYIHKEEADFAVKQESFMNLKVNVIEEGDVFDLGGMKLEVIELPGHTMGSIGLLDRENKILFSGDTVSLGPVYMFGAHRNKDAYKESLLKLKAMGAERIFTTIYPCHNTCPIENDTIDELLACIDGIIKHSIQGKPAKMPMPMENPSLHAQVGRCGILY
ncbi:MAG: MBL fold metallo-hydrolase [Lachnospiraceae bacterium]|nr:MBL fold metallo-hydrolase [Lachnospiraceae bacterium]MDD3614700.1 MBL fold metallo-hydrolase [Lachnospiraceae bacterium]